MRFFTDYLEVEDRIRIRYGVWFSDIEKKRGSVLLLNGRSEFLEKHEETVRELVQKGHDVFSFDWRGQGLSSRMLSNRHKSFVENFSDYVKDMESFVRRMVLPRAVRPLTILSHSMGGHIAIRFLHDYPGLIDRAILVSPMLDIRTFPYPEWFVKGLTRFAVRFGYSQSYALGRGDYKLIRFRNNKLTSDPKRFSDELMAIKKNPDLALGGVTYGWLSAAFDSINIISQPGYVEKIKIPILMIGAVKDRVVSSILHRRTSLRLENCKAVFLPDARHEILKESDEIRQIFQNVSDQFMAESDQPTPPPAPPLKGEGRPHPSSPPLPFQGRGLGG